jgi:hypothetical protein
MQIDRDYEVWVGTPRQVKTWRNGGWTTVTVQDIGRAPQPPAPADEDRALAPEMLEDGVMSYVRTRNGKTPIWVKIVRYLTDKPEGATVPEIADATGVSYSATASCVSGRPLLFEMSRVQVERYMAGKKHGRLKSIVTLRKESGG